MAARPLALRHLSLPNNPDIAFLSVGEKNRYGHPNDEVIERKAPNTTIYSTDQHGGITYRFY